jgi:hypothetical protein
VIPDFYGEFRLLYPKRIFTADSRGLMQMKDIATDTHRYTLMRAREIKKIVAGKYLG